MSKNKNKPKKVEEAVNPIVFGCNALADKMFDFATKMATSSLVDSYMKDFVVFYRTWNTKNCIYWVIFFGNFS